jgi:hypothetical protein
LQYLPEHAAQAGSSSSSSSKGTFGGKLHNRTRHRHHSLHKEKNWNPFVYNNELYFSQVRLNEHHSCTFLTTHTSFGNWFKMLLPAHVLRLHSQFPSLYLWCMYSKVQ